MYDVAILGLGPAGATLARLIDPALRVIAIDPRTRESGCVKPCGGLLAPDAQKALARFSLTLPKDVLVDPQIFSVRTLDLENGLVRHYQRFYVNLDRLKFDHWLRSLIPGHVTRLEGVSAAKIERAERGFRVRLSDGAEIACRHLVGAGGANSLVRRFLYPGHRPRAYVAIQQWFETEDSRPFYLCVFDPENTDCYSWGLSKDGRLLFGGAYPPKDCRARHEPLPPPRHRGLHGAPTPGAPGPQMRPRRRVSHRRGGRLHQPQFAGGRLLGDRDRAPSG